MSGRDCSSADILSVRKRRSGLSYFQILMPRPAASGTTVAEGTVAEGTVAEGTVAGVTVAGATVAGATVAVWWTFAMVALLAAACSPVDTTDSLPDDPGLHELALALRSDGDGEPGPSRSESGRLLLKLLSPVEEALSGSLLTLDAVGAGSPRSFELTLRNPDAEPVLELHLFYRPGLPEGVRRTYGDHEVDGYPAMATSQEQVFVLAGNFEVRAFQRAAEFRSDERLLEVVSLLPLDALAEL